MHSGTTANQENGTSYNTSTAVIYNNKNPNARGNNSSNPDIVVTIVICLVTVLAFASILLVIWCLCKRKKKEIPVRHQGDDVKKAHKFDSYTNLLNKGARALRIFFDETIPPPTLQKHLSDNEDIIAKGQHKFDKKQLRVIYPGQDVNPSSAKFDITILYKLLRNTCATILKEPTSGWGEDPEFDSITKTDDVERIRMHRNTIIHATVSTMDQHVFNLKAIDLGQAIIRLSNCSLEEEVSKELKKELNIKMEWKSSFIVSASSTNKTKKKSSQKLLNDFCDTFQEMVKLIPHQKDSDGVCMTLNKLEGFVDPLIESEQFVDINKLVKAVKENVKTWSRINNEEALIVLEHQANWIINIQKKYDCTFVCKRGSLIVEFNFNSYSGYVKYEQDKRNGTFESEIKNFLRHHSYCEKFDLEPEDISFHVEYSKVNVHSYTCMHESAEEMPSTGTISRQRSGMRTSDFKKLENSDDIKKLTQETKDEEKNVVRTRGIKISKQTRKSNDESKGDVGWNVTGEEVTFILETSLRVPGVNACIHISCVSSESVWVSDRILRLVDERGNVIKAVTGRQTPYTGSQTVTRDGDLLFIDSKDKHVYRVAGKKQILTLQTDKCTLSCIFSSLRNGDLLIGGDCRDDRGNIRGGVIMRYNKTGDTCIQKIETDEAGRHLYKGPRYITENKNSDIIVSDLNVLVVVDKSGRHRFTYTGHAPGSKAVHFGVCTDTSGHILVCEYYSASVHVLTRDGEFLCILETQDHGIIAPQGICMDNEQRVWVGDGISNRVCIYRFSSLQ